MRRRARAALGTRRGRVVLALLALIALAGGGYAVAEHGATSLRITAWSHVMVYQDGQPFVPDAKVFDKTFDDLGLVHDAQELLNSESRGWLQKGGCVLASPTYIYQFRFATLGVTTQVYEGNPDCALWECRVFGASSPWTMDVSPPTLEALHERTGMPLPRWLRANEGTATGDGT
jgi:hypothetical protein